MVNSLKSEVERGGDCGHGPLLLCSSQIRLPLKRLTERSLPALAVVAYSEVVPGIEVEAVGNVAAGAAVGIAA
jgi:flagellar biosynthesis protein FlhA